MRAWQTAQVERSGWVGRAESRRTRRLLAQMDRDARRSARRARWRPADRSLVALAAVLGLTVGGAVTLRATGWDIAQLARPRAYIEVDGRAVAVPHAQASGGRVLPAVPVASTGTYAFLHTTEDGVPVGYDPCRPVEYVIRPDGMPAVGQALIDDAVAIVSAASGIAFVAGGLTTEPPEVDRALIQPERYGDGWVPVLVAWSDESEMSELAGQVAGVGGSAQVPGADGTGSWLAAGRVVLDTADMEALLAGPAGYERARAIAVHELSHVLGLDHVDDPDELMHPVTAARTDLGPGDLAGLALLGQARCED